MECVTGPAPRERGDGIVTDLLRDNELIYGRLLPVSEPHLIERYNKALVAFGLQPTKLDLASISTAPAFRRRSPRSSATTSISTPTRSTAVSSS